MQLFYAKSANWHPLCVYAAAAGGCALRHLLSELPHSLLYLKNIIAGWIKVVASVLRYALCCGCAAADI